MTKLAAMTVWNVQHGLAIHTKSPNKKNIVIDLGTGNENFWNESLLTKLLLEDITRMIITHPHLDHISDIDVLDCNRPAILCTSREISRFKTAVENAQVLVTAHHGREKGFHKEFVELVKAKICIISDSEKSDTSAISEYEKLTTGLNVHFANGKMQTRKCLTTRKDGNILVEFGIDVMNLMHLVIKTF